MGPLQFEHDMRVWLDDVACRHDSQLSRHAQVNQKRRFVFVSVLGFKLNNDKFPMTPHADDSTAGKLHFERGGIVDEIRLA